MQTVSYRHQNPKKPLLEKAERLTVEFNSLKFHFSRYSSQELRAAIDNVLGLQGWTERVPIDSSSRLTITAMNGKTGLCVQTGNVARYYADLLKLEYMFDSGKIDGGVLIVLVRENARKVGNNVAYFERIHSELELFSCTISIPLILIGLDK